MKKLNKKWLVLSLILALAVLGAVGGTLALLTDNTSPLANIFQPAQVSCVITETFNGSEKTDVRVTNTSNIPAYIRAAVVVTWTAEDGSISAKAPQHGTDYSLDIDLANGWAYHNDGYYYYTSAVEVGAFTNQLIKSAKALTVKEGYQLTVEVIAEAIQSQPDEAVLEAWGVLPTSLLGQ